MGLSLGSVEVQIERREGTVWIEAGLVEKAGYQHPPFEDEIKAAIASS